MQSQTLTEFNYNHAIKPSARRGSTEPNVVTSTENQPGHHGNDSLCQILLQSHKKINRITPDTTAQECDRYILMDYRQRNCE